MISWDADGRYVASYLATDDGKDELERCQQVQVDLEKIVRAAYWEGRKAAQETAAQSRMIGERTKQYQILIALAALLDDWKDDPKRCVLAVGDFARGLFHGVP